MSDSETSFLADKKFVCKESFPYGLSRSGEFNRKQVALLEQHGQAYDALHKGLRAPINDEERAFIECCNGQKPAETEHEKAWVAFCEKSKRKPIIFSFNSSTKSGNSSEPELAIADDDWD